MSDLFTVASGIVNFSSPLVSIEFKSIGVFSFRLLRGLNYFVLEMECAAGSDPFEHLTKLDLFPDPPKDALVHGHFRVLTDTQEGIPLGVQTHDALCDAFGIVDRA
jgi:hypothetical protein